VARGRRCAAGGRRPAQDRGQALALAEGSLERIALIHGDKAGWLGERGLYDQVKAILLAVASEHDAGDAAGAASPHWLRHACARTLVVDRRVPLPAAQALLGHASMQTTAAYAKTDLSQLREFVEAGFDQEAGRQRS